MMIDGSSLRYALRSLSTDVDYRKLRDAFVGNARLVRAMYYVLTPHLDDPQLRRLLDWLDYNGYVVREKRGREVVQANSYRTLRGRVSIEMAVDALEIAPLIDHLILFSGDGDLAALVEAVQRKGVRVTAVSTLTTRPAMIANELRRQVDCFIDLCELIPFIGRPTSPSDVPTTNADTPPRG
jgi:uncharacterized LabA/DUF88 family protein